MIRRFNRFELKYLIPAQVALDLLVDLRAHMVPDPEGGPTGTYRIRSLYYDSRDFACLRSKVDGNLYRRKVRLRVYGDAVVTTASPAMLEIKQRIGRTTQKRRLPCDVRTAYAIGDGEHVEIANPEDQRIADEVHTLVGSLGLRPVCVIGYVRQAFMGGSYEPGIRITFDRNLTVREARMGFETPSQELAIVPRDWVVLEVKINDAVPLWVSRMLARHGCVLSAFSKYARGQGRLLGSPDWRFRPDEELPPKLVEKR